MKVLIIDNFDSFTFNLYQHVGEILSLQAQPFSVMVKRNNELSLADIIALRPDRIIISPGAGSPDDPTYFGVCHEVITKLGKTTPTLGVCLGMQGIASGFGGKVVRARLPMHGKTSPICHDGKGVFAGLPQRLEVMRYHSLMVADDGLPACLEISARVDTAEGMGEIMGIRHRDYPIEGVQFHPESFATEAAARLLGNFLFDKQPASL